MKNYLPKTIALAMVMTAIYGCTYETDTLETSQQLSEGSINVLTDTSIIEPALLDPPCFEAFPKSQITNNSNFPVNMEVFDENDVLLNSVYNVPIGEVSDYITFPVGVAKFKISTSQSVKVIVIEMGICMSYEVTINEFNHMDTDVPIQL